MSSRRTPAHETPSPASTFLQLDPGPQPRFRGFQRDASGKLVPWVPAEGTCAICLCTERRACVGGCEWALPPHPATQLGVCSRCAR